MTKDTLGDRMKEFEQVEAGRRLEYPVCIRLDGRSFSTFTRGLKRPYDTRLSRLMIDLTKALVEETGAVIGYTQSDEISLVLIGPKDADGYFGRKSQKLVSITAAFAAAFFARELSRKPVRIEERYGHTPLFDSRAWSVPTVEDAAAVLLWRELDARKNAVSMAASSFFSHGQLLGKNTDKKLIMLRDNHAICFDDYPVFFRRGTYIRRRTTTKPFTAEEIEALPPRHNARLNPELVVIRHVVEEYAIKAPLAHLANAAAVLFEGAEEITRPPATDGGE